jgi:hypothetical protein
MNPFHQTVALDRQWVRNLLCSRFQIVAFIIILVFAATDLYGGVVYTSIDTMKESRDREANNLASNSEINQIVSLCASQNVTHITVDTHWEYTNVIQQWVTAIRSQGKKIYWRGGPNQWNNQNGATGVMSLTNYNLAMVAFITNNPGFFASGDIFDPCPEPEDGPYWTNKYGANFNWFSSNPPGASSEYNNFLLNSTVMANAAFAQIGVSGVDTTVHSMNSWMAANVIFSSTLAAFSNRVCIDSYPEGTSTDPTTCANLRLSDLRAVANQWPTATILIGESGYANDVNVDDTTQSNVLAAEFNMYQTQSYIGGFNYWVGPGSTTAGGYTYVMKNSGGNWVARPGCSVLSNYFWNVLVPAAPQSLSAIMVNSNQVNLNWAANTEPNLAGYNIYRSMTNGFTPGPGSLIASNWPLNAYTNLDTFSVPPYYYRVTAISMVGLESAPSGQVSVGNTNIYVQIQPSGPNLVLTWPQGTLLEATNMNGLWVTNFTATSPYTVSPTNAQEFYRVQINVTLPTLKPISINFSGNGTLMASSEVAGVVPDSNWNNASTAGGSIVNLVDSTGAGSGASVSWSANGVFNTGVSDIAGNDRMMRNYLDTGNSTTTTITVSGLQANSGGWKIYVYFDGNNSETREGTYTISGTGIVTGSIYGIDSANTDFSGTFIQASNSVGNYIMFPIPNVSSFRVTATPVANGATYPRAPINGIQIIPQ